MLLASNNPTFFYNIFWTNDKKYVQLNTSYIPFLISNKTHRGIPANYTSLVFDLYG